MTAWSRYTEATMNRSEAALAFASALPYIAVLLRTRQSDTPTREEVSEEPPNGDPSNPSRPLGRAERGARS